MSHIAHMDQDWRVFIGGSTIGTQGTEGVILCDEEHTDGARITLEKNGIAAPYAVTCGIPGWLVHTRFFQTERTARKAFKAMKAGLASVLCIIPREEDVTDGTKLMQVNAALADFMERFP